MPKTTVDVGALYSALDRKRRSESLSWRDLAHQLGVSPSTFTRMAQGRRPDVDAFATLIGWLGMVPSDFTTAEGAEKESPEPIAMISSYLRADRNLDPEDAEALLDIIQAAYRRLKRSE